MDFKQLYQQVVGRCATLLNMDSSDITPDSNFFHLGGNSASALQLCVLIEDDFPELFGEEGIDLSQIAKQPDFRHFVEALLSNRENAQVHEGEL